MHLWKEQTGEGGNKMMQGVVKGHLCHTEHLQEGPPAGSTVSNWGFHRSPASHRGSSVCSVQVVREQKIGGWRA